MSRDGPVTPLRRGSLSGTPRSVERTGASSVHGACRFGHAMSGSLASSATGLLQPRRSVSPPLVATGDAEIDAYRKEYRSYRRGYARGAKGELADIAKRSAETLDLLQLRGQARHRRTTSSGGKDPFAERTSN